MTQAPCAFVRRDLVPAVTRLPLSQWQRFRDWQAGIRRNDPTTEEIVYAIKRGLRLATRMLPVNGADDEATNTRAGLVEDIDTQRRITGKSPDDAEIAGMLQRRLTPAVFVPNTLEADQYYQVVERNINPPRAAALEWLFARGGHHFIPQAVYKRLGLPPAALQVFREATSGTLMQGDHQNDRAHRKYSDAVSKEIDR